MIRYIEMNLLQHRHMNLIPHRQTAIESQKKLHHTIKDKNNKDLTEGDKIQFFPHYSGYEGTVSGKISEIIIPKNQSNPKFVLTIKTDEPLGGFRTTHTYNKVTSPVQWITYDEKSRIRPISPAITIPTENINKINQQTTTPRVLNDNSVLSDESSSYDDDFENWKATELFKMASISDDEPELPNFDVDPVYNQNDFNFQDGESLELKTTLS